MRKKHLVRAAWIGAVVLVLIWAQVRYMDGQMDSIRLVERLEATPTPAGLLLVDSWNHDGDWLFKPREPQAMRDYLAAGSVPDFCTSLDTFYAEHGLEIRPISRSDDPGDWCGRSVTVDGGRVSIWVEALRPWTTVPDELAGHGPLVEVQLAAARR